jgi:branched-chain amino acid transport system substrate-binding protein
VALTAVAVTALIAGCSSDGGEAGGSDSSEPFPVGIVTSLSPPGLVDLGEEAKEAVEAFVEWNNKSDTGVEFTIVGVEDDKGDPNVAREAVGRLIEKGAKAILGDMSSAVATAASPVATQQDVLYMVGGSWADELTAEDRPSAFRVGASNSGLALNGLLPYLQHLESEGVDSVGLLTEDSPYGTGSSDQLVKLLEEEAPGLAVHNEVYPADSTDVTAQLLRLQRAEPKPDVVVITAIGAARNLAIPQAFEVGLAPEAQLIAQWNWPTYGDFWEVVGEDGAGIQYVDFEAPDSEAYAMGETMAEAIGHEPSVWGAWAWDGMLALREALLVADSHDTEAVIAALEEVSFEGASGPIDFSTDADNYHDREAMPTYVLRLEELGDGAADAQREFFAEP